VALDVNATMDAIGVRLATISGLRVYDYPADSVTVPAGVVGLPELVVYDETYRRGLDMATLDVHVLVSKVSDRASRDAISGYLTTVKAAVDGTLGGAVADARVAEARSNTITVGGVDYLAVSFTVEVRA
jgi:hypothetical protein